MAPARTIVVLLASLLHARFASAAAANSLCRAVLPSASIATRGGTALAISTLLSLSLSLKFASAYAAYRHGAASHVCGSPGGCEPSKRLLRLPRCSASHHRQHSLWGRHATWWGTGQGPACTHILVRSVRLLCGRVTGCTAVLSRCAVPVIRGGRGGDAGGEVARGAIKARVYTVPGCRAFAH